MWYSFALRNIIITSQLLEHDFRLFGQRRFSHLRCGPTWLRGSQRRGPTHVGLFTRMYQFATQLSTLADRL